MRRGAWGGGGGGGLRGKCEIDACSSPAQMLVDGWPTECGWTSAKRPPAASPETPGPATLAPGNPKTHDEMLED